MNLNEIIEKKFKRAEDTEKPISRGACEGDRNQLIQSSGN